MTSFSSELSARAVIGRSHANWVAWRCLQPTNDSADEMGLVETRSDEAMLYV